MYSLLAMTSLSAVGLAADTPIAPQPATTDANGAGKKLVSAHGGPVAALRHLFEVGQASWYGFKVQGHKTATGEKYDMNDLTCAHRTFPLGSWLRVTNLHNHKTVLVRVNDRGPMVDDRIIDLSYAAAQAVGMNGVAKVKLEPVSSRDPEVAKAQMALLRSAELPLDDESLAGVMRKD